MVTTRPSRRTVAPVLAVALACAPATRAAAQEPATTAQAAATVSVDVRPRRIRIGDRLVLTVRVRAPADRIVEVGEPLFPESVYVLDGSDRSSLAVAAGGRSVSVRELSWTISTDVHGPLELEPLEVWTDGVLATHPVPRVEVLDAPLRRMAGGRAAPPQPRRSRDEPPILPEGRPPPVGGEDRAVIPGGRAAGTGLVLSIPGGGGGGGAAPGAVVPRGAVVPGGLRPGGITTGAVGPSDGWAAGVPGGWAEIAQQDPYWEEIVPRVEAWESTTRDPTGWVELSAGVSPGRVYVGQQLTYLAAAGFAPEAGYRMDTDPEYFAPSPADVWRVDVPRIGPGWIGVAQGELQDVRPFLQAFFPLRPGTLEIPPARLAYSLGGSGRYGPRDSLVTPPLRVEVLPVPVDQAPPGWDGAVGRYTVGVALDQEVLGPGEAAILTVTVRGAGNVESLAAPRPTNLRGIVLRPLEERAVVETRDGVVGGVKVFQWLVSVAEPGALSLGPFLLTYFDPWAGAFEIAATREIWLEGIGMR